MEEGKERGQDVPSMVKKLASWGPPLDWRKAFALPKNCWRARP